MDWQESRIGFTEAADLLFVYFVDTFRISNALFLS